VQKQSQYKKPNQTQEPKQTQEGSNGLTKLSEQQLDEVAGGSGGHNSANNPHALLESIVIF